MHGQAARRVVGTAGLLLLCGCSGRQSVLAPAGRDAVEIAGLFILMFIGAVVLWLVLNGAFYVVTHLRPRRMSRRFAEGLIIIGGIVFPAIVLAALLVHGLSLMPAQRLAGDGLVVRVTAEQWWWRVAYLRDGAETAIVSANEVRLPADRRSEIVLTSDTVIHSFWVPALGGKMDMIPGRETRMSLLPDGTRHLPRPMHRVLRRVARADGLRDRGDAPG